MSKFNKKEKKISKIVINQAGGTAFKQSDKLELVSWLLTSFVEDKYYENSTEQIERIYNLLSTLSDKEFICKAAIYSRTNFGMRSASHIIAAEIAKDVKGATWTRSFLDKIVYRPDDMTEILSYYLKKYGTPIPNSLKVGFARAFNRFNEYQLAKYRGENKEVSLIDVVNLVHPKPVKENAKALKALVKGKLVSTDTWESMLTKAGQTSENEDEKTEAKAEVWETLLKEKKLGYFAALRNINNVIKQGNDNTFDMLLDVLVNEKMIKGSLVFPYRYLTAINNLDGDSARVRKAKVALNKAIDISCKNVPQLSGNTLVVVDYSGSMGSGLDSHKGKGSLFGAILAKANNSDFMIFGDKASFIDYDPSQSTLKLTEEFMKNNEQRGEGYKQVGHGTNFNAVFEVASKPYDRIVYFSDMQGWAGGGAPYHSFKAFCSKFKTPKIYSIDLSGYGTSMFKENSIYCIAGFSDKIFEVMKLLEEDKQSLINKIDSIVL